MKKNATASALLILFGILAALAAGECLLRIANVAPLDESEKSHQLCGDQWLNVDIYRPFFEKTGETFVTVRPTAHDSRFPAVKPRDEKRVFIIGESVAFHYPSELLENSLAAISPNYRWRVINCGMGAYNSYMIRQVLAEIVDYQPDLIVLLMGNNDPFASFTTVHWPYRYPLVYKSALGRLLMRTLPKVKTDDDSRNAYFRENYLKMLALTGSRGIPLVVCTLPRNKLLPDKPLYFNEEQCFLPWWKALQRPGEYIAAAKGNDGGNWLLARACAALGDDRRANEYYRRQNCNAERNDILREGAKGRDLVLLADVQARVLAGTDGFPGYEVFSDMVHYWRDSYILFSEEIIDAALRHNAAGSATLLFGGAQPGPLRRKPFGEIAAANEAALCDDLRGRLLHCSWQRVIHGSMNIEVIEILRYARRKEPGLFADIERLIEANAAGDRSAERCSCYSMAYAFMGEVLREEGDMKGALRCLDRSVSYAPENPYAWLHRGLCYYDLRRKEEAEKDLARLRQLDPFFAWLTVARLDAALASR